MPNGTEAIKLMEAIDGLNAAVAGVGHALDNLNTCRVDQSTLLVAALLQTVFTGARITTLEAIARKEGTTVELYETLWKIADDVMDAQPRLDLSQPLQEM